LNAGISWDIGAAEPAAVAGSFASEGRAEQSVLRVYLCHPLGHPLVILCLCRPFDFELQISILFGEFGHGAWQLTPGRAMALGLARIRKFQSHSSRGWAGFLFPGYLF